MMISSSICLPESNIISFFFMAEEYSIVCYLFWLTALVVSVIHNQLACCFVTYGKVHDGVGMWLRKLLT
jgi:hypothetical protein